MYGLLHFALETTSSLKSKLYENSRILWKNLNHFHLYSHREDRRQQTASSVDVPCIDWQKILLPDWVTYHEVRRACIEYHEQRKSIVSYFHKHFAESIFTVVYTVANASSVAATTWCLSAPASVIWSCGERVPRMTHFDKISTYLLKLILIL